MMVRTLRVTPSGLLFRWPGQIRDEALERDWTQTGAIPCCPGPFSPGRPLVPGLEASAHRADPLQFAKLSYYNKLKSLPTAPSRIGLSRSISSPMHHPSVHREILGSIHAAALYGCSHPRILNQVTSPHACQILR